MEAINPVELHNRGVRLAREHRYSEAVDCLCRATEAGQVASYTALYATFIACSRISEAWQAARTYLSFAPHDYNFANQHFREIFKYGLTLRPAYKQVSVGDRPFVSFVICSHRDARFSAVRQEIERAAMEYPHEIIRIADAKCMSEGYQRGFNQSQGEIVVLCHDDIEFVIPDFMARLIAVMAGADMVGVAGSQRMTGPGVLFDGHPYIIGRVVQPHTEVTGGGQAAGYGLRMASLTTLRSPAQVLDGVFIAARRALLSALRFDTAIPGFHYYDVDLSYRAHLSGARVVVASDLTLFHNSMGNYDLSWFQAKEYFTSKFPMLSSTQDSATHYYAKEFVDKQMIHPLAQAFNDALS